MVTTYLYLLMNSMYLLQIKMDTRKHFVFMLTTQFDPNCSLFYLATKRK